MTREEQLKELIASKFGSIARFAEAAELPATTIRNIFTRGLGGVGADTVIKICATLDVDVEGLMNGTARQGRTVTFDDFTYAMHNETRALSQEKKQMLLDMARFFNEELQREKGSPNETDPEPV